MSKPAAPQNLTVMVNGKAASVAAGTTLAQLLAQRKIRPDVVTVELNDAMVERARFGGTALQQGDRLELVFYMGGGA